MTGGIRQYDRKTISRPGHKATGRFAFQGATMATVGIAFGAAMDGTAPVLAAQPVASEAITSSAASQQSTSTAPASPAVCTITSIGGAIWVTFGTNPTAVAGTGYLIPDGATRDFGRLAPGWKVAVIDA